MTNKNPTVATLICCECGGPVTVRLMKQGAGRAYYRCNADTASGQCGTWVTFGPARTQALKASAAPAPKPIPKPITKEPDDVRDTEPEPEPDDGSFLTDW